MRRQRIEAQPAIPISDAAAAHRGLEALLDRPAVRWARWPRLPANAQRWSALLEGADTTRASLPFVSDVADGSYMVRNSEIAMTSTILITGDWLLVRVGTTDALWAGHRRAPLPGALHADLTRAGFWRSDRAALVRYGAYALLAKTLVLVGGCAAVALAAPDQVEGIWANISARVDLVGQLDHIRPRVFSFAFAGSGGSGWGLTGAGVRLAKQIRSPDGRLRLAADDIARRFGPTGPLRPDEIGPFVRAVGDKVMPILQLFFPFNLAGAVLAASGLPAGSGDRPADAFEFDADRRILVVIDDASVPAPVEGALGIPSDRGLARQRRQPAARRRPGDRRRLRRQRRARRRRGGAGQRGRRRCRLGLLRPQDADP